MSGSRISRWFDLGRFCRWTAYSIGARDARLMDSAYSQADHVTKYRLPADGSEIDSTQWASTKLRRIR